MMTLEALDKKEIYRYLGCPPEEKHPVPELEQLVDGCIARVLAASAPRTVFSPALELNAQPQLHAATLPLAGEDIGLHLQHCTHVILLAVTLGAQLDAMIRRAEAMDMAQAVVMDAAASVAVEQAAQQAEESLRTQLAAEGRYLTGRYSPGYGDFPLTVQREVLHLTDAGRKIGLTVTPSNIMTPRKSITAVLGVAEIPVRGHLAGCSHCVLQKTCIFRKRGKRCVVSDQ